MDTTNLGSRERELGNTPEAKRPSVAARALVMPDAAAEPPPLAGGSVMDVDVVSAALVLDPLRVQSEAPGINV
jgi:hypothetical protein